MLCTAMSKKLVYFQLGFLNRTFEVKRYMLTESMFVCSFIYA